MGPTIDVGKPSSGSVRHVQPSNSRESAVANLALVAEMEGQTPRQRIRVRFAL